MSQGMSSILCFVENVLRKTASVRLTNETPMAAFKQATVLQRLEVIRQIISVNYRFGLS